MPPQKVSEKKKKKTAALTRAKQRLAIMSLLNSSLSDRRSQPYWTEAWNILPAASCSANRLRLSVFCSVCWTL